MNKAGKTHRAVRYRLYPTAEQAVLFAKTFGCCRKVYNLMLADKIDSYRTSGKFGTQTPARYKKDYPYLREVDSLALANVQIHLQEAMKSCFDKKRRRCNGFPQFKSAKNSRRSYTTNNQKGTVMLIGDRHIKLPKAGLVRAVIHRFPEPGWVLKSATISQERDGKFYASVLFEYDSYILPVPVSDRAAGLDYKSDGLYMDSNGCGPQGYRKNYRRNQERLARAQRKLKHMVPGSNNYKKQQLAAARIQRHTAAQRLDDLHKRSTEIANRYDVVCVESLDMKAMANRKFGNGKATLDNGYGMFLKMLEYKLADRGRHLVKVDKWYPSSQICSCCGRKKKLTLSERTYQCTCGLVLDRDHNAAINIKREGLRILMGT